MGLQGAARQKRCPLEAKLVQKGLNVRVVNPVNTYATELHSTNAVHQIHCELHIALMMIRRGKKQGCAPSCPRCQCSEALVDGWECCKT
jgi:hypothetical protein